MACRQQDGDSAQGWVWAIALAHHEVKDRAIIFRYVKEFPNWFNRSMKPDRVILVWRYNSENEMPQRIRGSHLLFDAWLSSCDRVASA